jgi:phage shock protein E
MFKKILTTTIITAATIALTACSNSNVATAETMLDTATTETMLDSTTNETMSDAEQAESVETFVAADLQYEKIIDVRTLEEWNEGRIEGAIRIGVESPDFTTQLEQLDKTEDYFIYCRSGNRAGKAIKLMRDMGFTGELVNGDSLERASNMLKLPVVK